MMRRLMNTGTWVVVQAAVLLALVAALLFSLESGFPSLAARLEASAGIATVATLLAVIMAFLEYRRQVVFDRTQRGVEFMLDFYNNQRLDPFRLAMRNRDEAFTPFEADGSLKDDVVLGMNYLEALAIAHDEGTLHTSLVERMLGTVICEVGHHPALRRLRESRFDYENFYGRLLPRIEKERQRRGKECR